VSKDESLLQKILGKIFFSSFRNEINHFFSPYAGDMLVLTAVDLPELHHLSDVIVFSTEGDRK